MADNDFWEEQLRNWVEQSSNKNSARALSPKTMSGALTNRSKVKRMSLLPYPQLGADGSIDMTDWVAPQVAIDLIESAQLPGQVYRGEKAGTPEEARKMAVDVNFGSALLGKAPAGSLGMFAGRRAKTANLEKMKIAQKMLDDGVDRTDVWKQTGWMRGPDGKMRFEIDDSGSALNLNYVTDENMGDALIRRYNETDKIQTSEDVLHHNDLYGAYPDLEDIHTAPGAAGRGASYSPNFTLTKGAQGKELIQHGGGDAVSSRSPQLHELQHAVQHQEGFARGGNRGDAVESLLSVRNAELKKISKAMDGRESELGLSGYRPNTDDSVLNTMRQRYDYLQQTNPATDEAAYEWYKRLAGEAEARNVQTRMNYSPEQRLDEPPWTTLDVPESDMIVRGATDGPQMSIPMDEASRMARAKVAADENPLLSLPNESKMIGREKVVSDGPDLKIMEADPDYAPGGRRSFRYVQYENGEPVGALQFMTKGPRSKKATIQNVYTAEGKRRQKVAANLLRRAQKDFDIKHSDDLTDAGRAFKGADGTAYSNPGDPLSAAAALQKQYEDEQLLKFLETGA